MKNTKYDFEVVTETTENGKVVANGILASGFVFKLNLALAVDYVKMSYGKDILAAEAEGREVAILCSPFCSK